MDSFVVPQEGQLEARGQHLAFAGLSFAVAACSAPSALNLGRDIVEAWYREGEYSSTSAVNLLDRAHLGVVVTMHEAHTGRVAAVGDSVVVDIHCSGSNSPGPLEETRPRTGQP